VIVGGRPAQPFRGQVSRISERAEYTPRNIATQEGRMLTYYAVEIRLANEQMLLKPGMPADATFEALADTSR
jgi:HlyD family secretion protein